jgi:hypothetical protein
MRLDSVIYLIGVTTGANEAGDAIETPTRRETFAKKKSVRQSEFYQAAATGLKPVLTFEVWLHEYQGESELEYNEQVYQIIRTYSPDDKWLELVCDGTVVR